MSYSNLADALKSKRSDMRFYPVIYFEGLPNDVLANEYGKFIDTIVLASASYYNVSNLERNLSHFRETFSRKSYPVCSLSHYNLQLYKARL